MNTLATIPDFNNDHQRFGVTNILNIIHGYNYPLPLKKMKLSIKVYIFKRLKDIFYGFFNSKRAAIKALYPHRMSKNSQTKKSTDYLNAPVPYNPAAPRVQGPCTASAASGPSRAKLFIPIIASTNSFYPNHIPNNNTE